MSTSSAVVPGKIVVDLGGCWQCASADGAESFPAQVPGCVHTDLLAAGKIEEPFFRDNEDRLQWIGETEWRFTRTFTVDAATLARPRVLLRCEGLDTLATIFVNGTEIGSTDNMFRAWEFDVKAALRAGENTIEVRFASPMSYIEEKQVAKTIPCWGGKKEPKGRAWVRKEPCSFGWDWGPVFITCGIWRAISLVAFDVARVTDVLVLQDHTAGDGVVLGIHGEVEHAAATALTAAVCVTFNGQTIAATTVPVAGNKVTATLTVTDPHLWWPNNMGAQPLYDVTVTLLDGDAAVDTASRRIGLRTLRLDRHPDQWGESFQFAVNGVPFFAKGGNWIPSDSFVTRITEERYRDLLTSVVDANMNMLRVWGGGIYEQDTFYNLCDEMGICVWQDFMFACSTYPTFDADFIGSVKAEAEDNVRRLRHHPSLALWCGNNELEQGMVGDAWSDWQMSWEDYSLLFDALLPDVIHANDPERDYWPCSPHTPIGDRKNFNDPTCGDAHLWDVWHGRKPFEWYRTCEHRFNSEFGFQSFPEPKTVFGYTEPQDRNVTTYVMEHHQRSGIGNTVIMQYMLDWYRLPSSFTHTLWLSQILQGMAIKYAVEHWRRAMPRGMGTLYWQINDCWPVASWASIDYYGRWKALQFMAKHFYAPLLVSGLEDIEKGTVEIHVTSDRLQDTAGTVRWSLTDLDGNTLTGGEREVAIPALKNSLATTIDVHSYLQGDGTRTRLFWIELLVDGARVSSNLVLFARPKHLELREPQIAASVQATGVNTFAVTLTAAAPALWTWLELDGVDARFSDNFLHLRAGVPFTVQAVAAAPLTAAEFEQRLCVRSLVDTYREG